MVFQPDLSGLFFRLAMLHLRHAMVLLGLMVLSDAAKDVARVHGIHPAKQGV